MRQIFRDTTILFVLYCIAHSGILLNNGIYWDDWFIINVQPEALINKYKQMGLPFLGYFHHAITSSGNIIAYKAITFFCYWIAGLALFKTLKTIPEIDRISRFFITLFFLIFPINTARVACINTFYAICYALFYTGLRTTVLYIQTKKQWWKRISLALFFTSFLTNSLLFFYIIPVLYIVYTERSDIKSFHDVMRKLMQYKSYVALPFLFWMIKLIFLMPYGLYEGYNRITALQFLSSFNPVQLSYLFYINVVELLHWALRLLSAKIALISFVSTMLLCYFLKNNSTLKNNDTSEAHTLYGLLFGIIAFIIAVIPYISVQHIPDFGDWNSRNQLLLPLGISFFLCYLFYLTRASVRVYIYIVVSLLLISVNIMSYAEYQMDWYKQTALVQAFRENAMIKNHSTFLVEDRATVYDAKKREYRFYEYSGMMKMAFGDETRFAINVARYKDLDRMLIQLSSADLRKEYNLKDYIPSKPQYVIRIEPSSVHISDWSEVAKFRYYEIFYPEMFKSTLSNLFVVTLEKL